MTLLSRSTLPDVCGKVIKQMPEIHSWLPPKPIRQTDYVGWFPRQRSREISRDSNQLVIRDRSKINGNYSQKRFLAHWHMIEIVPNAFGH